MLFLYYSRGRIYANMDELYQEVAPDEEDPYGYGDESIYDSICYYQAPVRWLYHSGCLLLFISLSLSLSLSLFLSFSLFHFSTAGQDK